MSRIKVGSTVLLHSLSIKLPPTLMKKCRSPERSLVCCFHTIIKICIQYKFLPWLVDNCSSRIPTVPNFYSTSRAHKLSALLHCILNDNNWMFFHHGWLAYLKKPTKTGLIARTQHQAGIRRALPGSQGAVGWGGGGFLYILNLLKSPEIPYLCLYYVYVLVGADLYVLSLSSFSFWSLTFFTHALRDSQDALNTPNKINERYGWYIKEGNRIPNE